MCGRYVLAPTQAALARLGVGYDGTLFTPRYNVAPTMQMPVRTEGGEIRAMRWGLVPHWATDLRIGSNMINARAETVREKPAFTSLLSNQRCLVYASGFYEWQQTTDHGKVPHFISVPGRELFGFAGLYTHWRSPEGEDIPTFTILTTSANALMLPLHNRMPVILSEETEAVWLDPDETEPECLLDVLAPYPAEAMACYAVSPAVNNPRNDGPDLLRQSA